MAKAANLLDRDFVASEVHQACLAYKLRKNRKLEASF